MTTRALAGLLAAVLPFAIGCGDSAASDGDGSSGGRESSDATSSSESSGSSSSESSGIADGSGSSSGSSSSESSGIADGSESGGPTGLEHGVVKLELQRGESQAADPFVGTATVTATLEYEACLLAFYDDHPGLRQDGREGEAVFGGADLGGEGWLDRLCAPGIDGLADCEVEDIAQELDTLPLLRVVYRITGELEGKLLQFGPLPTAALAACPEGLQPSVRVSAAGAVRGIADDGTLLWITESFSPGSASTDQGAAIVIHAAANGG